jgi:hypothetical protein
MSDQFHMNPLTFFGDGNTPFAVRFSAYAKWLLDENLETRRKNTTTLVQRQVDGVTEYSLTIRHPSDDGEGNNHVETTVLSSAVGFNPLTYETISFGRRELEVNWEYHKHGEILLPSRYEIRRYNWSQLRENEPQDEDANLVSHRIFELCESSLNQPVAPEAFELASLGLEYGDCLADEIERQLYVYDGEKFVPAAEFKLDPNRVSERRREEVNRTGTNLDHGPSDSSHDQTHRNENPWTQPDYEAEGLEALLHDYYGAPRLDDQFSAEMIAWGQADMSVLILVGGSAPTHD